MYLAKLFAFGIGLVPFTCHANEGKSYGTFAQPAARVRPRFRYWLPDASVPPQTVKADIESAGALGAGGVELLPFYNYGGGTPVVDWVKYGFGTEAFNEVFKGALEAHRDSDLVMDFAMGPNQGQGVPAEIDNPGLQWDLVCMTLRTQKNPSSIALRRFDKSHREHIPRTRPRAKHLTRFFQAGDQEILWRLSLPWSFQRKTKAYRQEQVRVRHTIIRDLRCSKTLSSTTLRLYRRTQADCQLILHQQGPQGHTAKYSLSTRL